MSLPPFPPEDRTLSPYTGWTRAHWETAADRLLGAALRHAGPGHALIALPGPRPSRSGPRSDALEGYVRTFLLAAFRVAGAGGRGPRGLLDRYAEGLTAGTRSPTTDRELTGRDPVAWPAVADRGQAMVEAASVALALRLTRPWLWDRLPAPTRARAADWLAGALHHTPVDNNWWLFQVTVGGFLAEAGHHTEAAERAVEQGLGRIERWYLGDGWYTDGRPRAVDHYNGWAFHLYPVLHAHLSGDTGLLDRYGTRLAAHLRQYAHTFGSDGAPLHQGRSLISRFASAAALWAGALTDRTPLTPGTTRRLASGALRHFLDRGAVDGDGLLTLGWYGPCPPLVQPYSGPASPYWAGKGFLGLLLPPDHPVWTATEEPAPAERADTVLVLPAPGWLVQSTAADGLVRLHNHGSDDQPADEVLPDDPLYARLAYSTATGRSSRGPWTTTSRCWSAARPATAARSTRSARATAGPPPRTAPGSRAPNCPASPSPPWCSSRATSRSMPTWSGEPPPEPGYGTPDGPWPGTRCAPPARTGGRTCAPSGPAGPRCCPRPSCCTDSTPRGRGTCPPEPPSGPPRRSRC